MAVNSPFAKIEREEPLSHKVERQIREAIQQKVFLPGDKLPGEFELAEKFGVSRTAVREALRLLSGRGLVDIRKGSGVYVTEMSMSNVVDPFYDLLEMKCGEAALLHIVRVRLFMEPPVAAMAVRHCTDEDIDYLRSKWEQMAQHKDDPLKNIESDIKFHRRIAGAAGNPLIPIIMEPIFQLLGKFISSTYRQSHAGKLAIEYHRQLVEHFEKRNADAAAETMRRHLTDAEKHVIQYFNSIGFTEFE